MPTDTSAELPDFANLLTPQQGLLLAACIAFGALLYLIPQFQQYRALLLENAAMVQKLSNLYQSAPPEARFRIEMEWRKGNAEYQRFLRKNPKGREWNARFQEFLKTPRGQEWKRRYEANE